MEQLLVLKLMLLTGDAMASLDHTKMSSRFLQVFTFLGRQLRTSNINSSSIQRARQNHRLLSARDLKARWDPP